MPALHVARSIVIDAPQDKVLAILRDYRQWPVWSPWLIMEPDCPLQYSGTQGEPGAAYTWNCAMMGEGKMTLVAVSERKLDMDLVFKRPFKSKARVVFEIEAAGDAQKVTWNMYGSLPFFMFFMTKMMKAWISMDYDRGLKMLKRYVESGSVPSKLDIIGTGEIAPVTYVGIENSAPSLAVMGDIMRADFKQLYALFEEKGWSIEAPPFSLYHHFEMSSTASQFISAIPVKNPVSVDAPFLCDTLPAAGTFTVKHTGDYEFLGNAWGMAKTAAQHRKIKLRKKPVGMERYLNNPAETKPEDLQTEVVLFRK
ncbi:MAG: SRPBCC family protein [Thiotrichales bacterium]